MAKVRKGPRRVKQELMSKDHPDLRNKLAAADIIMATFPHGDQEVLWRRRIEEVIARGGPPYNPLVITIPVASNEDLDQWRCEIDRLKRRDHLPDDHNLRKPK